MATETAPPAPGAFPSPSAHQLVLSQPPLRPFNRPPPSASEAGGGGPCTAVPCPPSSPGQLGTGPGAGRGGGLRGPQKPAGAASPNLALRRGRQALDPTSRGRDPRSSEGTPSPGAGTRSAARASSGKPRHAPTRQPPGRSRLPSRLAPPAPRRPPPDRPRSGATRGHHRPRGRATC